MSLTIFGGSGFVGSQYIRDYYDQAIGNIVSINERMDNVVRSEDVLFLISTVHNFHILNGEPYLDIFTNLVKLMQVLESWRYRLDSKDGVFNFISSWLVYGNQDTLPVPEGAQCFPRGLYSITKKAAEDLLIDYCTTFNLKYRILRLSNVVGPGDKKVSAQKNGLQFMVNKLAAGEDVEIYGDGMFHRDYTHVSDCSRAIDLVINKGATNEIYNIGNGKTWCFEDIIMYAFRELNSTSKITHVEPKEFQKQVVVRSFFMSTDKLKDLGYVPEYTGAKLFKTLTQR